MGSGGMDLWAQLEAALWARLEAHADFAALVRPANRLRMGQGGPRPRISSADLPEARLRLEGGPFEAAYSSTHSQQEEGIVLELASGDSRAAPVQRLREAVVKALAPAIEDRLGLGFIAEIELTESRQQQAPSREDERRGIGGWVALVRLRVLMQWPRGQAPGGEG